MLSDEMGDVDGDADGGFLMTLPSSLSPIDPIPDLGLFAPVTTEHMGAQLNATWNATSTNPAEEALGGCLTHSYVYEDFTQVDWIRAGFVVLYAVIDVLHETCSR